MEIRFGDWNFEVESIEEHKVAYSRLTSEQLHSFEAKLYVDNERKKAFEDIFDEYKAGEVYISDKELNLDNCRFNAKEERHYLNNSMDYTIFLISFDECSTKSVTEIVFEGLRLEPYKILQEISQNAIIIDAKVVVTKEQFEKIRQLKYGDTYYFSVIRVGIDETPLVMRFGRNLWSKENDNIKMSLVFVEKEYDQTQENYHGFAEPQLSNAINQIKQLRAMNKRLMKVLVANNIFTEEQKNEIEEELTINELRQEHYIYDQVSDIDEW